MVGSQKSGHDNDTTLRSEATPSPDPNRQILNDQQPQKQYPQQSFQQVNDTHDHNQQSLLQARHQQPQQQQQQPQQQQQQPERFMDDSQVGTQSQGRLSLDGTDAPSSVSRRRTLGKPAGYPVHESMEQPTRATQSIDETRRPTLSEMAAASSVSEFEPQQLQPGVCWMPTGPG